MSSYVIPLPTMPESTMLQFIVDLSVSAYQPTYSRSPPCKFIQYSRPYQKDGSYAVPEVGSSRGRYPKDRSIEHYRSSVG